ncbi:MAG: hypothetical protein ACQERZ_00310 [Fusobacteriota bacterium]
MKKIIIFIFMVSQISLIGYEIIGNPYGTDKKDFQHPISIQKENENIYVMDYILGKIAIMDDNFKIIDTIEGLENPIAFKIIGNYIYVSESNNNKIIKINKKNKDKTIIGKYNMRRDNFNHPGNIYGFDDKIFIFDEYNYRIQILNKEDSQENIIQLPKFKYVYTPYYKTNYSMIKKGDRFYVLDSYNKEIYIIKENIMKENIMKENKTKYELQEKVKLYNIDFPNKILKNDDKMYLYDEKKEKIYDFTVTTTKIQLDEDDEENYSLERSYEIKLKYDILKDNEKIRQNEIIQSNQLFILNNTVFFLRDNTILSVYLKTGSEKPKAKLERELKNIKSYEYIKPVDIFVDKSGMLYILDEELNKVLIFDEKGNFVRNIDNIGKKPTGIGIGKNGNIYIASSKENQIIKYNKQGIVLRRYGDYEEFSIYKPSLKNESYVKKLEENPELIRYNFDLSLDNDNIYVMDSKNMDVDKYDYYFQKKTTMGKKATLISVLKKELKPGEFGWDGYFKNNLTDIFVYKKKLYVIDELYKRINIFDNSLFKNGEFEAYYTDDFGDQSIKGLYINDDKIYITDSKKFRILRYDLNFENKEEISFVNDDLMPIKIYGKYVIAAKETLNYKKQYLVLNIEEYLDDKDKKSGSNN